MMRNYKNESRAGFSLIEVMVATMILLIIVLMIGSVFRQGTSSWDSGYARAEGGMIIRSVIGSIQRELSTAVDGRLFPGAWDHEDPVDVSSTEVKFICMAESRIEANKLIREPMLVTYRWAGKEMKRSAQVLKNNNGTWATGTAVDSVIYSENYQSDKKAIYSADFEFDTEQDFDGVRDNESPEFNDGIFWNIPYVSITVRLTRLSSFSGLEVRSWGPDGKEDTGDDILVK